MNVISGPPVVAVLLLKSHEIHHDLSSIQSFLFGGASLQGMSGFYEDYTIKVAAEEARAKKSRAENFVCAPLFCEISVVLTKMGQTWA